MPNEPAKTTKAGTTQSQTPAVQIEREKMQEAAEHLKEALDILSNVLDKVCDARNVLHDLDIWKPEQLSWLNAKVGVSKAEEELRKIEDDMIRYALDLALPPTDKV